VWKEILRFEIPYQLKQPLPWITAVFLLLAALFWMSTEACVAGSGAPPSTSRNAPYVIAHAMAGLTTLIMFVVTAFVASSVLRDFKLGTHELFFSKPITKLDYLGGRLAGSMLLSTALLLAVILGMIGAQFVPWQDAQRLGPFRIEPYLAALAVLALPNLVAMGAIFFAIASWSRSWLATYVCLVIYLVLQDEVEMLVTDFDSLFLGSLLEPLGIVSLKATARYWTGVEYDTVVPLFSGPLLANRLLWLGIGSACLIAAYWRFSYARATSRRRWKRPKIVTAR